MIAVAYRLPNSSSIETVLAKDPHAYPRDMCPLGPREDCVLLVIPSDRPRNADAILRDRLLASAATPFTLCFDTVVDVVASPVILYYDWPWLALGLLGAH
jgi:hypothetical protein